MSYLTDNGGIRNLTHSDNIHDAIVIGSDGTCIESSNPAYIGQRIHVTNKSESPLVESQSVADDENPTKSYSIIENFAKLLMDKYKHQRHIDNIDLIITKLINTDSQTEVKSLSMEAEALGYDFKVKRSAILIHLDNFSEECNSDDKIESENEEVIKKWKNRIKNCVNGFFTKNSDIIVAYIGGENFVVFKAIDDDYRNSFYKLMKSSYKSIFSPLKFGKISNITVGFGFPHGEVVGLRESYKEAEMALQVGKKIDSEAQCYFFGDMDILHILADGDKNKKLSFANKIIRKLDGNNESLQTLEAFFNQNLNLTDTSRELKIHRNTVIYRLNQISETLNMDPFCFEDACKIKIALTVKKILE